MIGESVRRTEDPTLLRGEGRYTDDLNEPGQAYAYIVRSPYAHGKLRGLNLEAAKQLPGVLAIYTAADLAAYGPYKCALDFKQRDGTPMTKPIRKSLASDKVRFALALDKDGKFLALRCSGFGNVGAYLSTVAPQPPSMNLVCNAAASTCRSARAGP
jgi:CO/xanthine dehydrogenase Mo-binding subunit